jgi:hypothetical protein
VRQARYVREARDPFLGKGGLRASHWMLDATPWVVTKIDAVSCFGIVGRRIQE